MHLHRKKYHFREDPLWSARCLLLGKPLSRRVVPRLRIALADWLSAIVQRMSVSGQSLFCQPESLLSSRVRKGVGSSLRMPRRKSRRLSTRGSIPFCKIMRVTAAVGCVILIPFYGSGLISVLPCSGPVGGWLDTDVGPGGCGYVCQSLPNGAPHFRIGQTKCTGNGQDYPPGVRGAPKTWEVFGTARPVTRDQLFQCFSNAPKCANDAGTIWRLDLRTHDRSNFPFSDVPLQGRPAIVARSCWCSRYVFL